MTVTVTLNARQRHAPSPSPGPTADVSADGWVGLPWSWNSGSGHVHTGVRRRSHPITINGDATFEADEVFRVDITNPTGANIADGNANVTISNDELRPGATSASTA